jgi:hypothetical protein
MPSFLAWLNYSEGERQKALDVIDALRQKDSRDELGLGGIRDALADVLFPGTSTIQTRARYFLFIPWIYRSLQEKGVQASEIVLSARKAEVALIKALIDAGETDGVIGIERRERLKRLPSNIYWLGLERWGIRRLHGSQTDFHRIWKRITGAGSAFRNDDGENLSDACASPWHAKLPAPPSGFPWKASFKLPTEEASFLREQVTTLHPRTFLAFLLDHCNTWESVVFPWGHPRAGDAPAHIREELAESRIFSEIMLGAAILYNLMLAEKLAAAQSGGTGAAADQVDDYRLQLQEWARGEGCAPLSPGWPTDRFWTIALSTNQNISSRGRKFVSAWGAHAADARGGGKADTAAARQLVSDRELAVKGAKKARLHDASALALWNGAAGMGQMDFRWGRAQRIVLDILEGAPRA